MSQAGWLQPVPRPEPGAPRLHYRARRDHASLWHHDDPAADVVTVAIGLLDLLLVDEAGAIPDAGVLVDDDVVEDDVAADAERRPAIGGDHVFVEIGAEQHRARDARAALNVGADANDRLLHAASV